MPGITGLIASPLRQEHQGKVALMVKRMMHESFYTAGTYINEKMGAYVGWICHAGSFSDCAPVWNEERQVCLVLSGEIFSDGEEIDFLKSKGHRFQRENASYLVHLYEEIGPDFVKNLNGWFAGVLIDLREGRIHLFNDRYGMERIYFHDGSDGFYFASEAKALLKVLLGRPWRDVLLRVCVAEQDFIFRYIAGSWRLALDLCRRWAAPSKTSLLYAGLLGATAAAQGLRILRRV